MKVYVSGNCLSGTLANCLSVMMPNVAVERLDGDVDPASLAAADDIVFRQRRPLVPWTLRPTAPNEILYPVRGDVPAMAAVGYEPRHVLVSATYSKSALRAAADEIEREHPRVWYFPAYEIVASAFAKGVHYESDLRSVSAAGVDHVMRLFLAHCAAEGELPLEPDARLLEENRAGADMPCDEEAIADRDSDWIEYRHLLELEKSNLAWLSTEPPPTSIPMEALAPSSMRARVDAQLPGVLTARRIAVVQCTVSNHGDAVLVTGGNTRSSCAIAGTTRTDSRPK